MHTVEKFLEGFGGKKITPKIFNIPLCITLNEFL